MSYIRDLKRTLLFKLLQLEDAKFAAHVKTFRFIRDRILDGPDRQGKQLQFEAEDSEADAQTKHPSNKASSRKSVRPFQHGRA